jgi:hypothetical protein
LTWPGEARKKTGGWGRGGRKGRRVKEGMEGNGREGREGRRGRSGATTVVEGRKRCQTKNCDMNMTCFFFMFFSALGNGRGGDSGGGVGENEQVEA